MHWPRLSFGWGYGLSNGLAKVVQARALDKVNAKRRQRLRVKLWLSES